MYEALTNALRSAEPRTAAQTSATNSERWLLFHLFVVVSPINSDVHAAIHANRIAAAHRVVGLNAHTATDEIGGWVLYNVGVESEYRRRDLGGTRRPNCLSGAGQRPSLEQQALGIEGWAT